MARALTTHVQWHDLAIELVAPPDWSQLFDELPEGVSSTGKPQIEIDLLDHPSGGAPIQIWVDGRWIRGDVRRAGSTWKLRFCCRERPPDRQLLWHLLERARMIDWASRGGLLLHGCGIENQGRVRIFLGPSGSGKTTLARKHRQARVVSDEFLWVEPHGRRVGPNAARLLNVEALFFIFQGASFQLKKLTPAEALAGLMANHFWALAPEIAVDIAMDSMRALAIAVPSFRLESTLDDDVEKLLPME